MWHRRLRHASIHLITKLINNDLVKGISNLSFEENKIYDTCQVGKQTRNTFKPKNIVSISEPLEFLQIDLFGPTKTQNLGEKTIVL